MDTDSGMRVLCDAIRIGSDNFNLPLPTTPLNQHQQSQQQPPLPASAGSQPPQSGPSHQCRICNRIYERADHLNRHLKSHENARPFKCDQCTKSFNRADLLSRHRGSHDRQSNGSTRIERADRASAACLACVTAKAKCQDQKPCARCVKKGISCEMSSNNTQSNSPASSRNDGPQLEMASAHQQATSTTQPKIGMSGALTNSKATQHISGIFDNNLANTTAFQQNLNYDHSMNSPQSEAQNSGYYNGVNLLPVTTEPYFDDSFNNFTFVTGNGAPNFPQDITFGDQDLDFSLWDIDLDSVELAYQITDSSTPEDHGNQDQKPSNRRAKDVSRRHAAFERSPWLYKPTPSDHALTDQADLNVDEDNIPSALTPSSPEANLAEFASCCITSKTRDQMLSLLFTMQRKDPSQVPSFPSLAMLNNIIQVFFVQDKYRVDNLIHTGTFEPSQTIPQLLNAIIAAGSTSISIPAIWKMGLALQEVVRHTVADVWEQNNSKIRNVETLQAFMLCLDIGLWSGFKRRMEIAESFAQPPVIMLRRGGYFGAHRSYFTAIPDIHDSGAILESKWQKWAEAESYKRLIIHLFIHDIHASIAMQKPPLIYFIELKFPLPCPRDLWRASTAIEWRNLYHSKIPPCTDIPNFMDAMQNIDILEAVSDHVDLHLCTLTILHGFWAQIWAYDQSKLFYPESKSAHRLSLLTEHRELYRDVSEFSAKIPHLTRNSPDAVLIAELFMLILHAPADELQRFAGKYGEDEAKQATAVFKNWSRSPNSRTAVWHAGQVLRAARRLTSAHLRGFNAIAVYYASLTLWVYGLMMQSRSANLSQKSTISSTTKKYTTQVRLNEAETAITRIFLSTDDGIPGLAITSNYDRQESSFVPLEATDRVLRVARDIYRSNFPVLDEPLPPLVENLGNLLRDLSSVPGSRVSRAGTEPREGPGRF